MTKITPQLFQKMLMIRELSGFKLKLVNIPMSKPMTPEDHKREVEALKTNVMATALAQVNNCSLRLRQLIEEAFYKASRANNSSVQGKLTMVSVRLNELIEILEDPEIQDFVGPINDEDMRRIKGLP